MCLPVSQVQHMIMLIAALMCCQLVSHALCHKFRDCTVNRSSWDLYEFRSIFKLIFFLDSSLKTYWDLMLKRIFGISNKPESLFAFHSKWRIHNFWTTYVILFTHINIYFLRLQYLVQQINGYQCFICMLLWIDHKNLLFWILILQLCLFFYSIAMANLHCNSNIEFTK